MGKRKPKYEAVRLSAKGVAARIRQPGRYRDTAERGLLLCVSHEVAASWQLRYELHGRERYLGLGSARVFNLKEARHRANAARKLLADGIDPIEQKRDGRAKAQLEAARHITFEDCARQYFKQVGDGFKNAKSHAQWLSSLERYCFPIIGKMSVADIETKDILRVLENENHEDHKGERLWDAIHDTMVRLRGRIERVLAWATTREYRRGDNPARWRNHLETALKQPGKQRERKHHAALPYSELPAFVAALQKREGVAPKALEFLTLTAARTSEVVGAQWDEIDFKSKIWTVPALRIKGGKEHRVPLSARAVALLKDVYREEGNDFVFIGPSTGGLSNMAMAQTMRRMGYGHVTVHGFRSTFMDWAHETTAFPKVVIDMALAHTVGDKVEAAYRRGDLLDKRTKLMQAWATYCASKPVKAKSDNVVALRAKT